MGKKTQNENWQLVVIIVLQNNKMQLLLSDVSSTIYNNMQHTHYSENYRIHVHIYQKCGKGTKDMNGAHLQYVWAVNNTTIYTLNMELLTMWPQMSVGCARGAWTVSCFEVN